MKDVLCIYFFMLFSFNLKAMELSFKTSRESGEVSFQNHKLVYLTPQKASSIAIKKCNSKIINDFKKDIFSGIKEKSPDKSKGPRGFIKINGRQFPIFLSTKIYKVFDNFHGKMESLRTESKFECMKENL